MLSNMVHILRQQNETEQRELIEFFFSLFPHNCYYSCILIALKAKSAILEMYDYR